VKSEPRFSEVLKAIGAEESLLDAVVDDAPFGVYVDRPEVGCVYANPALLEEFGVSWEQFCGYGWARFVHPADVPGLQTAISEYEQTLEPILVRYRVKHPDDSIRWVYARVHAIRDDQDKHICSIGTVEDITDRRAHNQRFAELQKLEAVGRLSARTAHDFNNILAVISMATELLSSESPPSTDQQHFDTILHAVDQAQRITEQLLILTGKRQALAEAVCLINKELLGLEPLFLHTAGERVSVDLDLDPRDVHIPLDHGQLGQIVLNLVTNARDAIRGPGSILVRTRLEANHIVLSVQDTGDGMTEQEMARALDPFYTTKEIGRGTGLGLATVDDLVTVVGGSISFESTKGAGTTVSVTLAAVEAPANIEKPKLTEIPMQASELQLLIVEDNDSLRQSMGYALAMHGYEILTANTLTQAREILERDNVDMVVCDVLLPDGQGTELLGNAPKLPFVYVTGFADGTEQALRDLGPNVSWLPKPFRIGELVAVMRQLWASFRQAKLVSDEERGAP
jgi:two-component system, cell cycle sensor histidine kinase and response regulator CckA